MSKFIEIEKNLILKSSVYFISEVSRYKKDEESPDKYAFSVEFGFGCGWQCITVKRSTQEQAEDERNRIIEELEKN